MNPAEPLTKTFIALPSIPISDHCCSGCFANTLGIQLSAEGEAVPTQVLRYPFGEPEVRDPRGAVEPNRRDLGDRQPHPPRLGGEFEADLEPVAAVDAHPLDEFA